MAETDLSTLIVATEDMIMLQNLSEETLLENMRERYVSNLIYTYTGTILVSVNPYRFLPLYTLPIAKRYQGKRIGSLPPHIFAIADDAFVNMSENNMSQSVIISGESGAGKTEATKLILQFLSTRTGKQSEVERKIIESSPILEAFGNAKTVRNNNSSRFGKFMEIHFDKKLEISGARIVQYLLEKSRIVSQAETERNYHIFYQLLSAPADRQKFELTKPEDYSYLNKSGCFTVDNVDDNEDFSIVKSSMQTLEFTPDEQEGIMICLAAVLHIGNVTFKAKDKGEGCQVANPAVTQTISNLLSCPQAQLETCLVQRVNFIRGEKFIVPLNMNECADNRDALAKSMYPADLRNLQTITMIFGRLHANSSTITFTIVITARILAVITIVKPTSYGTLFNWIVNRINTCIIGEQQKLFIGVLDIFGFENFKINSFEQFCINYTNEHFNHHIFKLEQEEYAREKINCEKIVFKDNQECIDLIEKKPMGIISLLDEECKFPKGTDKTWLDKLHQNHAKHPYYEAPKKAGVNFIVKHYAGDVSYDVTGFLDKNRDTLQEELLDLLYDSTNSFIGDQLYGEGKAEREEIRKDKGGTMKKKGNITVAQKFKDQLAALVQTLTNTVPHYVRCLKPNSQKKPDLWDPELVLAQLRYSGMLETIRIRRLGYPIRYTVKDFWDRYKAIVPSVRHTKDNRNNCQELLKQMTFLQKDEWQLGASKVFLRDNQRALLEDRRAQALTVVVKRIQKAARNFIGRQRFKRMRNAAIKLEARIRGYHAKVALVKKKRAIILAQALERRRKARTRYQKMHNASQVLQCAILKREAKRQYKELIAEKQRMLQERAAMDEGARAELEALEKRQKEDQERARQEQAQKDKADARNKKLDAMAEDEKQGLKELGLLGELNNLEDLLKKDLTLPPPISVDNVDDFDLLDQMANPEFFGSLGIPPAVSQLDQLAGIPPEAMNFDFLEGLPPPPEGLSLNDLPPPPDLLPPPGQEGSSSTPSAPLKKPPKREPPAIILPEEANNFSFKTFAINNFRDQKKKGTTQSEIYSWSKKLITGSLLKDLDGESLKLAEVVFGKIQAYMEKKGPGDTSFAKFILKKGVAHEDLRDEIFCQLCKQTTANPASDSNIKGWELLAFCSSTFFPSQSFIKYLGAYFFQENASSTDSVVREFASFCMKALRRTVMNGVRKFVPSAVEMASIMKRQPIVIRVKFMDGLEKAYVIDSATTAAEAFDIVTTGINLQDPTGFGLFEVYNNIARKLANADNIADAISKAESLTKSMKGKKIAFGFLYKKSIYFPLKTEFKDIIERDLMFNQTYADVIDCRLPCPEEVAISLAALKLQLDSGDYDEKRVIDQIGTRYIPESVRAKHTDDEWRKLIFDAHSKLVGKTKDDIKNTYITSCSKLPLYGAVIYNNIESKSPSFGLPAKFDFAINTNGLHVLDQATKQHVKSYQYSQLKGWTCTDPTTVEITLGSGPLLLTTEGEGARIVATLKEFAESLQVSSSFAKALYDYDVTDESLLSFKRGDVILIRDKIGHGWYLGELKGKVGSFPADYVEILLGEPAPSTGTVRLSTMVGKGASMTMHQFSSNPHAQAMADASVGVGTLRLRKEVKSTIRRKTIDMKTRMHFSRDPLKESLLELPGNLNKDAKDIFIMIMKYMGDYPSKGKEIRLIQDIIQMGIDVEPIRDEIYCQLIKQTTKNPKPESARLGWEVISLCCGAFLPSEEFQLHLSKYIEETITANADQACTDFATAALKRTGDLLIKGARKKASSEIEIEAIKSNKPLVIRIYLLDGTTKAIYVNSFTTVRDAVEDLNNKFNLTNADGFSLYEVNHEADTILPLSSTNYICDYLSHWERHLLPTDKGMDARFKFLYKRRVFTADDAVAEGQRYAEGNPFVFNLLFHQILYDVRNGRIPVSMEESVPLLALQLQIKFGVSDPNNPAVNKGNLLNYLPKHLRMTAFSQDEYLEKLAKEQFEIKNLPLNECKLNFIKKVKHYNLFGASIFNCVVKSKTFTNNNKYWIAFTRKGIGIWEPHTKEAKQFWAYDMIADFNPQGRDQFTISSGNLMKPDKYVFVGTEANYVNEIFALYKANWESHKRRNTIVT